MSRMDRHRITRKLASIGLAMAVTMSLMPASVGSAYAEDGTTEYLAAAQDDVIAEDVSAEEASLDLEETLTAELSDDTNIESIDIETEDFAASDENILSSEDILDFTVEEDAGLEEDGFIDEDVESAAAEETEKDIMMAASGENTTEEPNPEDTILGGGNVENLFIPSILANMGISLDDASGDTEGLLSAAGNVGEFVPGTIGTVPAENYNLTITASGNTAVINGAISSPWYAEAVCVDGEIVEVFPTTTNDRERIRRFSNYSFNMSSYVGTGYHTVFVRVRTTKNNKITGFLGRKKMICNTITDRPTYNGTFDVYSNYFNYYPFGPYQQNSTNRNGPYLYMEYSANGGKSWQRSGSMSFNSLQDVKLPTQKGYKIGGLRAKTTYKTRIRYGIYATYLTDNGGDGKRYFFGGPVRNTTTIKTGSASKPKIKSVTLKATKVKYHKLRWPGYYNVVGGSVFWHNSYVEKFYTAKVKVTVKLKKKPGTAGVFISLLGQTKWVKGNKKKYTATFTPTYNYWVKNPHSGKYKLQVNVYSGQNSSWGGYSPVYTKKKKVR